MSISRECRVSKSADVISAAGRCPERSHRGDGERMLRVTLDGYPRLSKVRLGPAIRSNA
jgi:hypothetical protein